MREWDDSQSGVQTAHKSNGSKKSATLTAHRSTRCHALNYNCNWCFFLGGGFSHRRSKQTTKATFYGLAWIDQSKRVGKRKTLLFQTLCNKMEIHTQYNVICFQYYSLHSSKNKQKPKQERQIDVASTSRLHTASTTRGKRKRSATADILLQSSPEDNPLFYDPFSTAVKRS